MPANDQDNIRHLRDYQPRPPVGDRPANLNFGSGDGTSGGMDGWQTSVEARLATIQTDIRDLRTAVTGTNTSVAGVDVRLATLTERVAHLPSKGFIVSASLLCLTVIAALIAFQGQIQAFLKITPH